MKQNYWFLKVFILFTGLASATFGATTESFQSDWKGWVEARHKDIDCPWLMSTEGKRVCEWPGTLELTQQKSGMNFDFEVEAFSEQALIPLPGDNKQWPTNVTLNGEKASVVQKDNKPYLSVTKGKHRIKGEFLWSRQPASLIIPAQIALVTLMENDKLVPVNRRDNRLFFRDQNNTKEEQKRESLNVEVYRLLSDGVPVMLETRLMLSISGRSREIHLGKLELANTEVIDISSALPARVEADGSMRIQVRAGEYAIVVKSRFINNVTEIKTQKNSDDWPETEYLVFKSNSDIRQVGIRGATSIDTSQVSIPAQWGNYPTYRLNSDTTLTLITEERGDKAPVANQLTVRRDLWLDFSGDTLTALDSIQGKMHQQWRLNASADSAIGRATVAGKPVLITNDQGKQGIEIRSHNINLIAVTRVNSPTDFTAIGWDSRADSFEATLHLPPGWRVLYADGVDDIFGSWIKKWDLWDIFLLLVLVATSHKLFGIKAALLAAVTLLVTYHENGSPIGLWPILLLVIAILPLLKDKLKRIVSGVGVITVAVLLVMIVSFAVTAFRLAIYPTLEKSVVSHYEQGRKQASYSSMEDSVEVLHKAPIVSMERGIVSGMSDQRQAIQSEKMKRESDIDLYEVDENDRIQTGPGLPTWMWNSIQLRASGPVTANQKITVTYSPPWLTSIWRILGVLLISAFAIVLSLRLVKLVQFNMVPELPSTAVSVLLTMLLTAGLICTNTDTLAAEEYPPKYLLDELEKRLLKAPDCLPGCASMDNGELMATETDIILTFNVYADADIAMPIPTGHWDAALDGVNESMVKKIDGQTTMSLGKGHHSITLKGKTRSDQFTINFPLPIHNFSVKSDYWIIEGLVDGRIPNKALHFSAKSEMQQEQTDTLIPDPVTPFVIVNRELILEKQWRLKSTVKRLAPLAGAVTVNVPLLEDEKVLTDIHINDGVASIQLNPTQQFFSWHSSIEPKEQLIWLAAEHPHLLETWRIKPSSLWRIRYHGIPPVKEEGQASSLQPHWKPWPGEKLDVAISRPEGIQGPVQTVEKAKLSYHAGKQLQKSTLNLDIRSSQGETYEVGLPKDAEILSVNLNGKLLNTPSSNSVKVQLQPGLQSLIIEFQQTAEIGWRSETPQILLPGNTTNVSIEYHLMRDRWPLFINGPAIGPAMLYWGVLCVILIGAVVLSLLAKRLNLEMPVAMLDWLLLGVGLSTVNGYGVIVVAVFFYILAFRKQKLQPGELSRFQFNGLQVCVIVLTIVAVLTLVTAIPIGLLSNPNMKVVGNDSYDNFYNYYQDRAVVGQFPTAQIYSVSLMSYRLVMLVWSLWLATRLIKWAIWWWAAFSAKETWKSNQEGLINA